MYDLEPATRTLAHLVNGVRDDQLTAATPCDEYSLGDLVEHVDGLSLAFTWAATKDERAFSGAAPQPDAAKLRAGWRDRIPEQLDALAEAWREPAAWEGMTRAGGVDLPGEVAAMVALDEVVLHGWDIARATGQPFDVDEQSLEVCLQFVTETAASPGESGLFKPPVPVRGDAPLVERVLGLSGRNPAWPAR